MFEKHSPRRDCAHRKLTGRSAATFPHSMRSQLTIFKKLIANTYGAYAGICGMLVAISAITGGFMMAPFRDGVSWYLTATKPPNNPIFEGDVGMNAGPGRSAAYVFSITACAAGKALQRLQLLAHQINGVRFNGVPRSSGADSFHATFDDVMRSAALRSAFPRTAASRGSVSSSLAGVPAVALARRAYAIVNAMCIAESAGYPCRFAALAGGL